MRTTLHRNNLLESPSKQAQAHKDSSALQVPAGSLPRNMEVILRNDAVERCRAGDTMLFIGTPIVVPDVAAITAPGERVTTKQGTHRCCHYRCDACMSENIMFNEKQSLTEVKQLAHAANNQAPFV